MRSHGSNFNPEHPAAVGQALRKIISCDRRSESDRVTDLLELSSRHQAESLPPQNIAQIFLAIGNRCNSDPSLLEVIKHPDLDNEIKRLIIFARRQIDAFDGRNIAETLRGLVFMDRTKVTLAEALLARAYGMIQSSSEEEESVAWNDDPSTGRVERLSPSDLVMTLGAVRLLKFDTGYFRAAVPAAVEERLYDFNELELALCARYLSALELPESASMVIDRMMPNLDSFDMKSIGILATAMKGLPNLSEGYCLSLADECERRLKIDPESVPVRDVVRLIDLLSERKLRHGAFVEIFCREMRARVDTFSVDDLVDTARGLAMLQEGDEEFFRAIGNKALCDRHYLEPEDISFLAWAFTSLGLSHDKLFESFADTLEGRYSDLDAKIAANIGWAFAPLQNEALAQRVVAQCAGACRAQEYETKRLRQIHIAEVAVGLVEPGRCDESIVQQAREERDSQPMNSFEKVVYDELVRLDIPGLDVVTGEIVEGLLPDFVVNYGERRIVIECDGVGYHLTAQGAMLGKDIIQDRLFRRCGYEVVHILDTHWRSLSLAERRDFLLEELGLERCH